MESHPFNSSFYVVAATVIPVWFVAIMFPGGAVYRFGLWAEAERDKRGPGPAGGGRLIGDRWHPLEAVRYLFTGVLMFSAGGEISAVVALNQGHVDSDLHFVVMVTLIGLPAVTAFLALFWLMEAPIAGPGRENSGGAN